MGHFTELSQRDGQLTSDSGLQPATNQGLHGREPTRPVRH